jgi:hypothetical protein
MSEPFHEGDPLEELQAMAAAAEKLARQREAFDEAFKAFLAHDTARFQAILDEAGVGEECHRICFLFCQKRCVGVCHRLCREREERAVDADEVREFVDAFSKVARSKQALSRLVSLAEKEDVRGWQAELRKHGLLPYCHQVCHFICRVRCRRICREICARPLITRVSSIPTSQFGPQGFGNGPSIPPFQVPPPNPPVGVGDHPVGGSSWLMGIFNMPTATQYKVEVASAPGGPYTAISVPVLGYASIFPYIPVTRFPSGGGDPGWYDVADIPLSDGGNSPLGEKTLLYWPTLPDGLYYLRLRVRDGSSELVSSPRAVMTDNTAPATPVITLELKKPNGQLEELKCGKVKKGSGLIRVTVQASDPNFSSLGVAAQGNSSLSVPIVAVPDPPGVGPAVPLSKTYNGNLADTGYPAPTSFLWDPWSDPAIVPCCYVVRIDIWDRTVINNVWGGGHGNSGWEAIEIGF